jgi:hypothetical protein
MTTRTLNYTQRSRIEIGWFRFRLKRDGEFLVAQLLSFDHSKLPGLPTDSKVVLNCFLGRVGNVRIECGTISNLLTNVEQRFWVGEQCLFQTHLLVSDVSDASRGKILARSSKVTRFLTGGAKSLLTVEPAPLGSQVWRLQIEEDRGPVLEINSRIGNFKSIVTSHYFSSLVNPEILRQIADWVLVNYEQFEIPGSIGSLWRQIIDDLGVELAESDLANDQERQELCIQLEEAFALRHKSVEALLRGDEEENSDD